MSPIRGRPLLLKAGAALLPLFLAVAAGCSERPSPAATGPQEEGLTPTSTVQSAPAALTSQTATGTYLLFNQQWLEGFREDSLDLDDVDEVFWHVFSRLPDQVTVYPSENYYYFTLYADRRQVWGNIRLPAGRRERGVLSFAYAEFRESPFVVEPRVGASKFYTDADGLRIEELDRFTYLVRYNGKEVTFNLHQLSQARPNLFQLGDDEVFVERTFDESGMQFFLIFNKRDNYFMWVLNEEEIVLDILVPQANDLLMGRKSGFAFWVDKAHNSRKILMAIRGTNATRNDYYDGPFDQLADNYVEEIPIAEYMIRASPGLRGRIDKYGYFTDRERSSRVSISPYYVYFSQFALDEYLDRLRASPDPYYFISHRGASPAPTPTPTPSGTSS